jgi:hypothetical protein
MDMNFPRHVLNRWIDIPPCDIGGREDRGQVLVAPVAAREKRLSMIPGIVMYATGFSLRRPAFSRG